MKNIRTVLLLLLITSSAQSLYAETPQAAPQPTKILVFGDSLSAAYNIKREQGWVSLLQNLVDQQGLKATIVNDSISGETTSGGLDRLPASLERHQPQVVILELGGNDGLRGFNLKTTRNNLSQMIQLSQQAKAQVLLAGIEIPPNLGRTYTSRFSAIYQDLSQDPAVGLIPFILEGVATNKALMQSDGIHPNAEGQPIIVETVWRQLKPMLIK